MGSFLAAFHGGFSFQVFIFSALTTIFLQILSNLANDYGDSVHGADSDDRKGPQRSVQSGVISPGEMKTAIGIFIALSLASGSYLIFISVGFDATLFLGFLGIGILAIIAAITYTAGARPYGYSGLGDISVLIFFGLVGVVGSYYLHVGSLVKADLFLPALSCGLFSVAVLNINNIRDIDSDKSAGKRSIPVRIGRKRAIVYHRIILVSGWLFAIAFVLLNYQSPFQFIFVITLPLFIKNIKGVNANKSPQELDPYLKQMAISTLLFVMSFGLGLILA